MTTATGQTAAGHTDTVRARSGLAWGVSGDAGEPWLAALGLPEVEPGDTGGLPAAPPVAATLGGFRGARAFFEPMAGNNGDDLIGYGAERELAVAGLERVDDPAAAEVLVLNGGGGMNDIWKVGFDRLGLHARHLDTPLVVLPSSYMFETTRLADLLGDRRAPTVMYTRERISVPALVEQASACSCAVTIGTDHDMALRLGGSAFAQRHRDARKAEHLLVIDRGDAESQHGTRPARIRASSQKKLVPNKLRQPIKRFINRRLQHRAALERPFFAEATEAFRGWKPDVAARRVLCADLSARDVASFAEWVDITRRSAGVASTRLHGAILPVLFGIPTLIRAGHIPKFRGVYELSLRHIDHARMIGEDGRLVDDAAAP